MDARPGPAQCRHRGRVVEALGGSPRPAPLPGRSLQVAPGQVHPHPVAENLRQRLRRRNVAATRAQRRHQLDLVVQILCHRRKADGGLLADRIGRLGEKEGRLAPRGPHFTGVLAIVLANTVNAVDRKPEIPARNGQGRPRSGRERPCRFLSGDLQRPVPAHREAAATRAPAPGSLR